MKLNIALLLISSASAFAPKASFVRQSHSLFMQDTTEAVEKAMEISETMGKTSVEARMAWELVEEMDAANSHEKKRKEEIERKQAEIESLMKQMEEEKLASSKATAVHRDTSDAVKKALEMSRVHGKSSVEARMAWEEVEEMDAANSHHKSDGATVAAEEAAVPGAPETFPPMIVEEAINNAMLLSKAYGKKAPETRLAWELVEELELATVTSETNSGLHSRGKWRKMLKSARNQPQKRKRFTSIPDTAVQAAMAASEKFGKTSIEARIAWELVEEIGATNAHHKDVGSG